MATVPPIPAVTLPGAPVQAVHWGVVRNPGRPRGFTRGKQRDGFGRRAVRHLSHDWGLLRLDTDRRVQNSSKGKRHPPEGRADARRTGHASLLPGARARARRPPLERVMLALPRMSVSQTHASTSPGTNPDETLPGRQPAPPEPPPLDHAPVPPLTAPEDTEGG